MGRAGLPTLQSLFPSAPRSELIELQRWHARVNRRGRRRVIRALRWCRAGAVWAIDFADPPAPIEEVYTKLLCVRDLSSGKVLMALPCPRARAETVLAVLEALVRWHGAPLVIKLDNGSAFIDERVKAWAERHRVLLLYSPPGTPSYNGSIEAGIGSIKTRALWIAARNDRPGDWTTDDVEAARRQANELCRPRGPLSSTPDEAWKARQPISDDQRERFHGTYERCYAEEKARQGWLECAQLQHREQATVDRVAITRTIVQHGILLFRRRRTTLPVSKARTRKIS